MSKKNSSGKILKLINEVEVYKQAIQDAKDALAAAEKELDEELTVLFEKHWNDDVQDKPIIQLVDYCE